MIKRHMRCAINPAVGWQDYQTRRIGFGLGLNSKQVRTLGKFMNALVKCYDEMDCSLMEINPLIITESEINEMFDRYEAALNDTVQWIKAEGLCG